MLALLPTSLGTQLVPGFPPLPIMIPRMFTSLYDKMNRASRTWLATNL